MLKTTNYKYKITPPFFFIVATETQIVLALIGKKKKKNNKIWHKGIKIKIN